MRHAGIFLLLLCLSFPGKSHSQTYMDAPRADFFLRVQRLIHDEKYEPALLLIDSAVRDDPADPGNYLLRATAMISRMAEREQDLYGRRFTILLDSIIMLSQNRMDGASPERKSWLLFFIGHAYAYRSLYEARFGSFFKAVKAGMKSDRYYEDGLAFDNRNYDLYLGIGLYHYWKSARAGILKLFRIIKNEKNKGIEELYLCHDSGRLFNEAARSSLIWVWDNEREYDSMLAIAGDFYRRYPDGKTYMWPIAQACFGLKKYHRSLEMFEMIRDRLLPDPGNYFNIIQCDYMIAQCYLALNDQNNAVQVSRRLDAYERNIPEDVRKRQRPALKLLRKLRRI